MDCPSDTRPVCVWSSALTVSNLSPSPLFLREDRPLLRIPKSFAHLQDLNYLLKKYRDIYPFRVLLSYVVTYLL